VSVVTEPLFPADDALAGLTEVPSGLSADRRRTLRRLQLIELGQHPITHLPLHPQAPADASRWDRYPRPFTCGTCAHRFILHAGTKSYRKCDLLTEPDQQSHSAVTDTFAWLPACLAYQPTAD